MNTTLSPAKLDHMSQICRERSSRGVATRADWQRLAAIDPDRARAELVNYLRTSELAAANPYESKGRRHSGMAVGFFVGVVVMCAWWLFGDFLQREVVTSGKQWDLVTFSQYVAATMLPVFAWLGSRWDQKQVATTHKENRPQVSLRDATWDELLTMFDSTRKAGGTRMY